LTDEDAAKHVKKQQKVTLRKQREKEMKRLRIAQEIQRQLEEVELKQKDVEQRGVAIEKSLQGEGSGESDLF